MTDTAVTDFGSDLIDGDVPRLAAAPTPVQPAPVVHDIAAETAADSAAGPIEFDVASLPVLPEVVLPLLPPSGPVAVHDTLAIPAALVSEVVAGQPEQRQHPMAHLMPERMKPNEASLRAAELRAAKKAKSRKITIAISIVMLVVAGVAGPPLAKWLVNAVNEAGSTKTETPAVVPASDQPEDGPAAGIEAIDDLNQLMGDSSADG